MRLGEKLKEFLKDNGLQMQWFAHKLGMPKQQFYQILGSHVMVPKRYWKSLVILTKGKITLADILKEKYRDFEDIEVKYHGAPGMAHVSLRDFNTEF